MSNPSGFSPRVSPRLWAIVPAAGIGSRFGADKPKQYLTVAGRTIIEHTLRRLLQIEELQQLVVVLSSQDPYWANLDIASHKKISTAEGGSERCHSVLNGLESIGSNADESDWVLVHDVARPCISLEELQLLLRELENDSVGGLLAEPISDTVKQTDQTGRVEATLDRDRLWRAQTPQMFRFGQLREALQQAVSAGELVTDEAAAIERMGGKPKLVRGRRSNLKVTLPEDLALAEYYISRDGEA